MDKSGGEGDKAIMDQIRELLWVKGDRTSSPPDGIGVDYGDREDMASRSIAMMPQTDAPLDGSNTGVGAGRGPAT
jgi:hypothetical protein